MISHLYEHIEIWSIKNFYGNGFFVTWACVRSVLRMVTNRFLIAKMWALPKNRNHFVSLVQK